MLRTYRLIFKGSIACRVEARLQNFYVNILSIAYGYRKTGFTKMRQPPRIIGRQNRRGNKKAGYFWMFIVDSCDYFFIARTYSINLDSMTSITRIEKPECNLINFKTVADVFSGEKKITPRFPR